MYILTKYISISGELLEILKVLKSKYLLFQILSFVFKFSIILCASCFMEFNTAKESSMPILPRLYNNEHLAFQCLNDWYLPKFSILT